MLRLLAIVGAAHAATLSAYGPASAAADIMLAALATGRLYVVGITERPNMPVVLDQQFRTESDDRGIFQYKLVYHPARCIISATIEGKSYEAVVSNCGQQGSSGPVIGSQYGVFRLHPAPRTTGPNWHLGDLQYHQA